MTRENIEYVLGVNNIHIYFNFLYNFKVIIYIGSINISSSLDNRLICAHLKINLLFMIY